MYSRAIWTPGCCAYVEYEEAEEMDSERSCSLASLEESFQPPGGRYHGADGDEEYDGFW